MEEKQNACFLDALPTKTEYLETGNECIGRESLIIPRSRTTTINEPFLAPQFGSAPPKMKWRNISPERPVPITLEQYESLRNDPYYSRAFYFGLQMGKFVFIEGNEPQIIDLENHLMPEEAEA